MKLCIKNVVIVCMWYAGVCRFCLNQQAGPILLGLGGFGSGPGPAAPTLVVEAASHG